jgi:hypothetical protein
MENEELTIKEMEDSELNELLAELNKYEPSTEEYAKILHNYRTLRELQIKQEDVERTHDDLKDKNEKDRKSEKWSKWADRAVDIGKFGVMLVAYAGLYVIGLNFEETGTVTSHPVKELVGSINPFKKVK